MTVIQRTSPAPASEAGAVVEGEIIPGFNYKVLASEDRVFVQQVTREIRQEEENIVAAAVRIGKRLIEVKERIGHGRYGDWLQAEFGRWSPSTAGNYRRMAKAFGDRTDLDALKIDLSGLYLLAAPSTPDELRTEVLARAAAGETITHGMVKALLAAHKTLPEPAAAPALPEPPPSAIIVEDAELFELAEASSSIGEGWLDYGRIKKPFPFQDKLWVSVGGAYGGGEDRRDCVRVVPVGTPYTPGESLGYRPGSYCGRRAWYRSTEYELTGQSLRVIRRRAASPPAEQPSADPERDYEQRIVAEAARYGLLLDWQQDGAVIIHWPGEDLAQLLALAPADALRWLRDEAPKRAMQRATETEIGAHLPPGWWLERQDEGEPGRAGRSHYRAMSDGPVSNWYETITEAVVEAWEIAGSPEPQAQQAEPAPQTQQPDADPGRFLIALAQGTAWRAPANATAEVEFWPGLLATARAILDGRLDALLAEAGPLEGTSVLSYQLVHAANALYNWQRIEARIIAKRPQDPAARLALQQAVLGLEQRMQIPPELPEDLRAVGCRWGRAGTQHELVDRQGDQLARGAFFEAIIVRARAELERRRAAAAAALVEADEVEDDEPETKVAGGVGTSDTAAFLAALRRGDRSLSGPYVGDLLAAAQWELRGIWYESLPLPSDGRTWPVSGPTLRSAIAHAAEALRRGDRADALALPERLFWGQDVRVACRVAIEALEVALLQQEAEATGERLDWQDDQWALYAPDIAEPVARFDSAESARAGIAWRREQRQAAQAEPKPKPMAAELDPELGRRLEAVGGRVDGRKAAPNGTHYIIEYGPAHKRQRCLMLPARIAELVKQLELEKGVRAELSRLAAQPWPLRTTLEPSTHPNEAEPVSSWSDADLDWLDRVVEANGVFHEAMGTNILNGWGTPAQAHATLAQALAPLLAAACPPLGAVGAPALAALLAAENRHQAKSTLMALAYAVALGEVGYERLRDQVQAVLDGEPMGEEVRRILITLVKAYGVQGEGDV